MISRRTSASGGWFVLVLALALAGSLAPRVGAARNPCARRHGPRRRCRSARLLASRPDGCPPIRRAPRTVPRPTRVSPRRNPSLDFEEQRKRGDVSLEQAFRGRRGALLLPLPVFGGTTGALLARRRGFGNPNHPARLRGRRRHRPAAILRDHLRNRHLRPRGRARRSARGRGRDARLHEPPKRAYARRRFCTRGIS